MRTSATHPPNILPFPLRWHVWHVFFACGNSVSPTENHQKLNQKPWSRNLGPVVFQQPVFWILVSSSPRFETPPKPMIRNITMTETSWFFEPWDPLNLKWIINPKSITIPIPNHLLSYCLGPFQDFEKNEWKPKLWVLRTEKNAQYQYQATHHPSVPTCKNIAKQNFAHDMTTGKPTISHRCQNSRVGSWFDPFVDVFASQHDILPKSLLSNQHVWKSKSSLKVSAECNFFVGNCHRVAATKRRLAGPLIKRGRTRRLLFWCGPVTYLPLIAVYWQFRVKWRAKISICSLWDIIVGETMCVLAKPKIDLMKHNFSVSGFQYPSERSFWTQVLNLGEHDFLWKKTNNICKQHHLEFIFIGFWTSLGKRLQFLNLSCNLLKNGWNGFEQVIPRVASFNGDESQGFPGKIASVFITWKANLNNCGDAPSDHGQCLSTMCIHLLSFTMSLWATEKKQLISIPSCCTG